MKREWSGEDISLDFFPLGYYRGYRSIVSLRILGKSCLLHRVLSFGIVPTFFSYQRCFTRIWQSCNELLPYAGNEFFVKFSFFFFSRCDEKSWRRIVRSWINLTRLCSLFYNLISLKTRIEWFQSFETRIYVYFILILGFEISVKWLIIQN